MCAIYRIGIRSVSWQRVKVSIIYFSRYFSLCYKKFNDLQIIVCSVLVWENQK